MVDVRDIHSLSDFQRRTKEHIERLKQTGKPEVLTVNGQAEIVVQSAQSYQQLIEDAELARSLKVIRRSLEEGRAGKGRSMKQFLEELATRNGIKLRP